MQHFLLFLCYFLNINSIVKLNEMNFSSIVRIENLFCLQTETCFIDYEYFASPSLLPVKPPHEKSKQCCRKECGCELEECMAADSCCPDTIDYWSTYSPSKVKTFCTYPQLRPYNDMYPNSDGQIKMFMMCSDSFDKENDIFHKCEDPGTINDIDTLIPVMDGDGRNYKNKFCALCHKVNEADLDEWTLKTMCLKGLTKPPGSLDDILKSKKCNLLYYKSLVTPDASCTAISKCNVSGHWKEYDSFIEAACLGYNRLYNEQYKNIFCYFCNTDDDAGVKDCKPIENKYIVDFNDILRKRVVNEKDKVCGSNKIHDPVKDFCIDIMCEFPKIMLNGKCIKHVEYAGGITYQLYLRFIPPSAVNSSSSYWYGLKDAIKSWLRKKISFIGHISLGFFEKLDESDENSNILYFVVRVRVSFGIFPVMKTDIIDYMLSVIGTSMDATVSGNIVMFDVEEAVYDNEKQGKSGPPVYEPTPGKLRFVFADSYKERYPITHITFLYGCPFVELNTYDYGIRRENHSVTFREFKTTINANEVYYRYNDDINFVYMCVSTFERLVTPFIDMCDEKVSLQEILTLVCFSISIAFSIITIFFYLRIKRLKYTQPGINNIVLCIALIVAQVLFQIGDPCMISKQACKIMGIFIHFSWLFLIFWMNICCIHMVRVFRFTQIRQTFYNAPKTTFVYFLYACTASMILVLANISAALNRSEGNDIGYGGTACYINDALMIAYFFALPVATIVVINISLFIIVMLHLKNAPKVQSDKEDRNLIHIYARLSTLTGGTWLFGFTSFFLNVDVLDYIFIILNAPQGLFLFFAFVANKRTLKLVLKKDRDDVATTSSYSTYRHS